MTAVVDRHDIDGKTYYIKVHRTAFTARGKKDDIFFLAPNPFKNGNFGVKIDGAWYVMALVFAAESGEQLCRYGRAPIPKWLTREWLIDRGYVQGEASDANPSQVPPVVDLPGTR